MAGSVAALDSPRHGKRSENRSPLFDRRSVVCLCLLAIIALACAAHFLQPHDAKNVIDTQTASGNFNNRPANTEVVVAIEGSVRWPLAKLKEAGANNCDMLSSLANANLGKRSLIASTLAKNSYSFAWLACLVLIVVSVASVRRTVKRRRQGYNDIVGPVQSFILAVALLFGVSISPGAVVYYENLPREKIATIFSAEFSELSAQTANRNRELVEYVLGWDEEEDEAVRKSTTESVLAGEPIDSAVAERYIEYSQQTSSARGSLNAWSAFAFVKIQNTSEWLFFQGARAFRDLWLVLCFGLLFAILLLAFWKKSPARFAFGAFFGCAFVALPGMAICSALCLLVAWLGANMPFSMAAWFGGALCLLVVDTIALVGAGFLIYRAAKLVIFCGKKSVSI